jgi:hypothetical protein
MLRALNRAGFVVKRRVVNAILKSARLSVAELTELL